MKKNTTELFEELKNSDSVEVFMQQNSDDLLIPKVHIHLQKLLKQKCLDKAYLAKQSGIERTYVYQLLSGKRNPSRDKLIIIALTLSLSLEQTQYLLKYASFRELYVRDVRDGLIIHAINKNYDVIATNALLESQLEKTL